MTDDTTRRDFLKAAGLALAGIASAGTWARAQEEDKPKEDEPKKDEPDYDDLFGDPDTDDEETRACPQCGALMYRQGRTWTCETCGYSYVE